MFTYLMLLAVLLTAMTALCEIMMCESRLLNDYQDYEIVIGGDFSVDLDRQ